MIRRYTLLLVLPVFLVGGCTSTTKSLLNGPELSPVGSGLNTASIDSPTLDQALAAENTNEDGSWIGGPADYFRDTRAISRGDLVTVRISLNDRASFANSTSRTRKAKADTGADFDVGFMGLLGQGTAEANVGSNSAASGQGNIARSERLEATITVIVTKVYPNGLLHVQGTQQAMVNSERRDVQIAGIINARDIRPDNSIDFSKIAEARVVYGGAGTVSDIQRPGWGLQLWDKVNPF